LRPTGPLMRGRNAEQHVHHQQRGGPLTVRRLCPGTFDILITRGNRVAGACRPRRRNPLPYAARLGRLRDATISSQSHRNRKHRRPSLATAAQHLCFGPAHGNIVRRFLGGLATGQGEIHAQPLARCPASLPPVKKATRGATARPSWHSGSAGARRRHRPHGATLSDRWQKRRRIAPGTVNGHGRCAGVVVSPASRRWLASSAGGARGLKPFHAMHLLAARGRIF